MRTCCSLLLYKIQFLARSADCRDYRSNAKQSFPSCGYGYTWLFAFFATAVQRSIILKRSLRNRCFESLPTIWAVALHYQQPNWSAILSGRVLFPNTFKSLISNECHYFAFHISFLTMLVLTNDVILCDQVRGTMNHLQDRSVVGFRYLRKLFCAAIRNCSLKHIKNYLFEILAVTLQLIQRLRRRSQSQSSKYSFGPHNEFRWRCWQYSLAKKEAGLTNQPRLSFGTLTTYNLERFTRTSSSLLLLLLLLLSSSLLSLSSSTSFA